MVGFSPYNHGQTFLLITLTHGIQVGIIVCANGCANSMNMESNMNIQAFYHQPKSNYNFALDENTIVIRFRAGKGDVKNIRLIYGDKYAVGGDPNAAGGVDENWISEHHCADMDLERSDEFYDYYIYKVKADSINFRLSYVFIIEGYSEEGEKTLYYTEWGPQHDLDPKELHLHYFNFPYLNEVDIHKIPEWVKDAVFYQIFPERFHNGNRSNDPENIECWNTGIPARENFFGGDLEGIIEKVDHLSELGVNAIYMTPVFKSTTNHKYDTTDYFEIDPHFGDKETLKKLVDICHEKKIKVVLDAVFNHCGYMFDKFQDVVEKGKDSPYYDWFYIKQWPIDFDEITYQTFGFEPKMPKLNTANPEVIDYLIKVGTYWIEYADIDGWRLDVANEIDHAFWRTFRTAVKSIKPDAYIVGEIWHNAQPWLIGDQFDGSMNYPFTRACLQYFAWNKGTPKEFADMINTNIVRYTHQANIAMLNILDSHDTPRFLTESQGNKTALKMAGLFQMTFEGAPSVYYGTEIGMEGAGDPDCRRPMQWEKSKWDLDMFDFYKKIIDIRHSGTEFRQGDFQFVFHDQVLIYRKIHEASQSIVIMNRTEEDHNISIPLTANRPAYDKINKCNEPDQVFDLLGGGAYKVNEGKVTMIVKSKAMHVLKVRGENA